MLEYLKDLKNYVPQDYQDEVEKRAFLKFVSSFDDVLTRKNLLGSLTASAFVVDDKMEKTLIVNHNIYEGYFYPGRHADGEDNLLKVAIREVEEETGLIVKPVNDVPISIQTLPAKSHYRKGEFVPSHTHYDFLYLLMVEKESMDSIRIQSYENSDVKWIDMNSYDENELVDFVRPVFRRVISKVKK